MTAERDAKASRGAAPYRGGSERAAPGGPEDQGLVGDLIRQFADPLAFYRELIQNAIDAGSTSILAQLVWEPDPDEDTGVMRASVKDDGTGMSRAILEEDLTVLFRSSKEDRDDAIGKFGVGFVSVLAVSPDVVIVDSSTGDGVRWSLHLHPDQTYDLYRTDGAPDRGTTVSLHIPMPASERAGFVARSEAALVRWCGHARVPIRLVAIEPGQGEPLRDARIDRPLAVDAVVSVHARSRDGLTTVVAGLPAAGGRVGAFYNQGLLLHETRDHRLGEVAFKVMDSRLEHTLSRDDVRRDEHYERAVALVASTIRGPLADAVSAEMSNAAEAHSRGAEAAGPRMLALIDALARADLAIGRDAAIVPIVARAGESGIARVAELEGGYVSREGRTPLAEALARSGVRVMDASFAVSVADRERLELWLRGLIEQSPVRDSDAWTLVEPVDIDASDRALLDASSALIGAVARTPSSMVIARVHGLAASHLAFAGTSAADPWLIGASSMGGDPLRLIARPPIVLVADHPIVALARQRVRTAPTIAAALLARAVLVSLGALDAARDAALTEHTLRLALGLEARR